MLCTLAKDTTFTEGIDKRLNVHTASNLRQLDAWTEAYGQGSAPPGADKLPSTYDSITSPGLSYLYPGLATVDYTVPCNVYCKLREN